jgi:YVTN family beta-propeller protein
MRVPRVAAAAAAIFAILPWLGCGDVYRPIAIPVANSGGGNPTNISTALTINQGPSGANGATSVLDASGDTNLGNVVTGITPVHATVIGGGAFTANRGDDTLTGQNVGSNPAETFTVPLKSAPTDPAVQPVFLYSTGAMVGGTNGFFTFVAGFNSGTVIAVNSSVNPPHVAQTFNVGTHPVAITGLSGGSKLYSVDRDSDQVSVINPNASSILNAILKTISVGASPVYALTNPNGLAVYVLSQGSAPSISVINPVNDTAGAPILLSSTGNPACLDTPMNTPCASMSFDPMLKRLYVADYGGKLWIFDASGATLSLLKEVSVGTNPVAVAVLPDGSKAYVLNKGSAATDSCGAPTGKGQVSVIDSTSNTVTTCVAVADTPVWIAASTDGTKVFVPHQGGTPGTQTISTSTNMVNADLPAPLSNPNDPTSALTNPVFVLTQ